MGTGGINTIVSPLTGVSTAAALPGGMTMDNTDIGQTTPGLLDWNSPHISWDPIVYGSVSAGTGTYTTQEGWYTVHDNVAFIQMQLAWSAHTGSGNMLIDNLPVPIANYTGYNPEGIINLINIALPANPVNTIVTSLAGNTFLSVYTTKSSGTLQPVSLSSSGEAHLTMTYLTS